MNSSSLSAPGAFLQRAAHALGFAALLSVVALPASLFAAPPKAPEKPLEPRIAVSAETTPGDEQYSYKITQPGSYYLSSAVTGSTGKSGIGILVAGVTLDLNGLSVVGLDENVSGIQVLNTYGSVRIYNGSMRNWGATGIQIINSTALLESIIVTDSGSGIDLRYASSASIQKCVSESNLNNGFAGDPESVVVVENSISRGNGSAGFFFSHATLRGCVAYDNLGSGFELWKSDATDCIAEANKVWGFRLSASLLSGSKVTANSVTGVFSTGSSTIIDNLITGHSVAGSAGIEINGSGHRIEGNNLQANSIGLKVNTFGNFIARNSARSLVKNYEIAAGNRVGTVLVPPLSVAIDGNSGGGSGTTDPWSNIAY